MTRRSREYALSLHFRSHPDNLTRVKEKVFQLARRAGFSQLDSKKVAGVIERACLGIIETTYRNNSEMPILLRGIHHGDRIEFRVRDFGKKSDPRTFFSHSASADQDAMDQAEYDSAVTMGGELCLVKLKPQRSVTVAKASKSRKTKSRSLKRARRAK